MSDPSPQDRWNRRYLEADLPWDTAHHAPQLAACLDRIGSLDPPARRVNRAIEVGCGTGTNTIYLASRGIETLGVDIAPRAIEMARAKADSAAVTNARFEVFVIALAPPAPPSSFDFAFDRGCFHSMDAEGRTAFAGHLAEALAPGAPWLSLCGNADERRAEDEQGPPQLSVADIATAVEPWFEVHELHRTRFTDDGVPSHLAWSLLARRREAG